MHDSIQGYRVQGLQANAQIFCCNHASLVFHTSCTSEISKKIIFIYLYICCSLIKLIHLHNKNNTVYITWYI